MTAPPRDRDHEGVFLGRAAAGHTPFAVQASERLERGEMLFGDGWRERGIAELVRELLEEAADIGAWGALADQAVDDAEPASATIVAALTIAAWHGARAHEALTLAASVIEAPT